MKFFSNQVLIPIAILGVWYIHTQIMYEGYRTARLFFDPKKDGGNGPTRIRGPLVDMS